jgi:hypothetical protein
LATEWLPDLLEEVSDGPALPLSRTTTGEGSSSVNDIEADEMKEHLRGLGYLE